MTKVLVNSTNIHERQKQKQAKQKSTDIDIQQTKKAGNKQNIVCGIFYKLFLCDQVFATKIPL